MINQILALMGFFSVAIIVMGIALRFAKYKERKSACCGGGSCSSGIDHDHEGPKTCKKNKEVPTF